MKYLQCLHLEQPFNTFIFPHKKVDPSSAITNNNCLLINSYYLHTLKEDTKFVFRIQLVDKK